MGLKYERCQWIAKYLVLRKSDQGGIEINSFSLSMPTFSRENQTKVGLKSSVAESDNLAYERENQTKVGLKYFEFLTYKNRQIEKIRPRWD